MCTLLYARCIHGISRKYKRRHKSLEQILTGRRTYLVKLVTEASSQRPTKLKRVFLLYFFSFNRCIINMYTRLGQKVETCANRTDDDQTLGPTVTLMLTLATLQMRRTRRRKPKRARQGQEPTSICGSSSRSSSSSPPSMATTSTGSIGRRESSRSLTRSRSPLCGERERWEEQQIFLIKCKISSLYESQKTFLLYL